MMIPIPYMAGNFLTSRLIRSRGERFLMRLGQVGTLGGLLVMLALAVAGVNTPLAFAMPLILLGIGHGLLMPPALAGTVSLVPALAGSAAAVAGLLQQLTGALGGYVVGLVPHHGSFNLGLMMLGSSLVAVAAQILLHGRFSRPAPIVSKA
jgi:DHA1 family bicyclomycin/chloramphenicol resistance-like MFS transporter